MVSTKQIDELTKGDFERSPYWMFYSGSNGEYDSFTTLIPQNHHDYNDENIRLIFTKYRFKNGQVYSGFLYEDPPDFNQHTIFYKDTGFEIWFGIVPPDRNILDEIYNMLGMNPDDIFPIMWETTGQEYSGTIDSFGYIADNISQKMR